MREKMQEVHPDPIDAGCFYTHRDDGRFFWGLGTAVCEVIRRDWEDMMVKEIVQDIKMNAADSCFVTGTHKKCFTCAGCTKVKAGAVRDDARLFSQFSNCPVNGLFLRAIDTVATSMDCKRHAAENYSIQVYNGNGYSFLNHHQDWVPT